MSGRGRYVLVAGILAFSFFLWRVQPASAVCFFLTDRCEVGGVELPTLADAGQVVVGAFFGILNGIVDALSAVATRIIALLPDMPNLGLPDMSGIVVGYGVMNAYFPLAEGLAGAGLWLVAVNASFLFRVGVTVWHLIPKPLSGT